MKELKIGDKLEVGDVLIIQNLTRNAFKITRVTKTLAISKRESDGFEYRFKRIVSYSMSHPPVRWCTSKHKAYRPNK